MRQERKGSLRRVTTWSPASAAAAVPLDNTQIPSPYTQGAFSEAVSATDGGSGPQRLSQFRGLPSSVSAGAVSAHANCRELAWSIW